MKLMMMMMMAMMMMMMICDGDDVMEGALVVGLVVWKCQCSMHEQQHSKCSNIPHKISNSILNVQIFLIKYPTAF